MSPPVDARQRTRDRTLTEYRPAHFPDHHSDRQAHGQAEHGHGPAAHYRTVSHIDHSQPRKAPAHGAGRNRSITRRPTATR